MSNGSSSSTHCNEKVNVSIRCRPMTATEKQTRVRRVVDCNSNKKEVNIITSSSGIGLSSTQTTKTYTFDKVFGPSASQLDIYNNIVSHHLSDVLKGYNCTVLAYGQTGTGKTYTMEGERSAGDEYTWDTDPKAGLIPRALNQLFDKLTSRECEYSVRASFMEIYNEEIYDLLSSGNVPKLKVYDDSSRKGSTIVHGLTEVHIRSKEDVYDILMQGATKRRTAATNLNERSSRSHSLFSVTVHTKDVTKNDMEMEELVRIGKLNLVDLAGSENIGRSGAVDKRAREAGNINTSLLTLGRCITALVDRAPHVPYRGSKLTRLLQDSLGGTTKTSIIATISPGHDNYEETLSTLDYAFRAKSIHNKPKVNQKLNKKALLKEYDDEIERLRRDLHASREKNGVYMDAKEHEEMTKKMEEMEATLASRQDEINKYTEMFEKSTEELSEMTERYQQVEQILADTRKLLFQEKALKVIHREHGEEVFAQATKLLDTAEHATTDLLGVHDKVDRVKTTNSENISHAQVFKNTVQDEAGKVSDDITELSKQNQIQVRRVMTTLDAAAEEQRDALSGINEMVKEFRTQMSEFEERNWEQISSLLSEISSQGSACYQQSANDMDVLKKKVFNLHHKNIQFKENLSNNLLTAVKGIEMHCQSTAQRITAERDLCEKYSASINDRMRVVKDTLTTSTDAQQDFIKNLISSSTSEMRDQISRIETSMFTKLAQSNEVYAVKIAEVFKEADHVVNEAAQLKDTLCGNMVAESEMVRNTQQVGEELRKTSQNAESHVEDSKKYADEYNELADNHISASQASTTALINTTQCVAEKGMKMKEEAVGLTHQLEGNVMKLCTMKSATLHEVANGLHSNLEEVDKIETTQQTRLQHHKDSLVTTAERFALQIQPDVPTGNTPAKKEYKFSREITKVPAEDDLLSRLPEMQNIDEALEEEDQAADDDETKENADIDEANTSEAAKEAKQRRVSYVIPDGGGIPFFQPTKRRKRRAIRPPAVMTESQLSTESVQE